MKEIISAEYEMMYRVVKDFSPFLCSVETINDEKSVIEIKRINTLIRHDEIMPCNILAQKYFLNDNFLL